MRIRWTVAVFALAVATGLWAQEKRVEDPAESKELNQRAYIRLLRSDLKAQKRQIIQEAMQLNDQQAAAFWPVYRDYDAEQTKLGDEKLAIVNDYAQNFLSMNDEKADQLAQRVMVLEDQRIALRRKYYEAMKKALPTVLVVRFFQVDNQIQLLVDLQIASNLPIIEQAQ
ncbi:MAG TPA: hypothetical protein VKR57_10665 [Terriglobales bacterium]|jgi:hypothetical protein|nr:hypothetical protein [Terriglobales bacterium]